MCSPLLAYTRQRFRTCVHDAARGRYALGLPFILLIHLPSATCAWKAMRASSRSHVDDKRTKCAILLADAVPRDYAQVARLNHTGSNCFIYPRPWRRPERSRMTGIPRALLTLDRLPSPTASLMLRPPPAVVSRLPSRPAKQVAKQSHLSTVGQLSQVPVAWSVA